MDLVFERQLHLRYNCNETTGVLRVGRAEEVQRENGTRFWLCHWSFPVLHPEIGKIYGLDPLDAFLNCIEFLQQLIEKHKTAGFIVWWHEEGDDGGLKRSAKTSRS